MSRKISYKGIIAPTTQQEISLKTINGKIGYKIVKFETISHSPGDGDIESVVKIYTKSQAGSITPIVDFSDSELLAVSYNKEQSNSTSPASQVIIFDNEMFNQNIFITCADALSGSIRSNYYIELEAMPISDLEATKLTLQSIRTIASR